MKSFYQTLTILLAIFSQGCDRRPHVFSISEEYEAGDGRGLYMEYADSLYTNNLSEPSRYYLLSNENLHCRDEKDLNGHLDETMGNMDKPHRRYILFFLHRADGRVDTLCDYEKNVCWTMLGYISGYRYYDRWIVFERKPLEKIVDRQDMCNPTAYDNGQKWQIKMQDCTYGGQEKVFNSPITDYWIASRFTTDLYGPFFKSELKAQMQKLGIPLPMKLNGCYDRYVYARDKNGEFTHDMPKAFYWPHHRDRTGTVIE